MATSWDREPVWVHGDVAVGNLLVRDGRLAAVLDFGSSGVGDPACDMVIAWTFLSGPSRDRFRAELGVDPGTWSRGRGWALWKALITCPASAPPRHRAGPRATAWLSAQRALEVVEGLAPAVLVGAHRLLVPQAAVGEADGGDTVRLLEVELDQLPGGVVVPEPGEGQAVGRVDLGVAAAAAVLDVLVRVAHHHPDRAADAQVHLGHGRLPVVLGVPPAADHLLAGPRVEHRLGGRLERALHLRMAG